MEYFRKKEKEIAEFLSGLIRFNTSNPPGDELEAAKFVGEKLSEYGLEYEILVSEGRRANIISRLRGVEEGPRLLLLSHLDVVPANAREWSVDPFSGLIKDGYIWGRGAIDDKSHVAVELFTLIGLLENRVKFRGEIIFAATADEEMGGKYGAGYLVEKYPDKVRAEYVLNEGGGFGIKFGDKTLFTVQTSEKGVYWFKLKIKGKPGHASIPRSGDNAIIKMSKIIGLIERNKPSIDVNRHVKLFIETLGKASGKGFIVKMLSSKFLLEKMLDRLDSAIASLLDAMLRNTIIPTKIHAGYKENIIPDEAECIFDCRLLPGYNESFVKEYLKKILGDMEYSVEFLHKDRASQSDINTSLYRIIKKVIVNAVPNSFITPFMSTGGTDSRYFRWKFNSIAYGFQPILVDTSLKEFMSMIHGIDERISIKNLVFSVKITYNVIREFMGVK